MADNSLDKAREEINEIDKEMAALFVRRMRAAEAVAEYKRERGLAILDKGREEEVIRRNSALVDDEGLRDFYIRFLRDTMATSRAYQAKLMADARPCGEGEYTALRLELGERGYDINIGRGLIDQADKLLKLDRRVLILTDSGVPREYAERVASQCGEARIMTVAEGEGSKSLSCLEAVLTKMLDFGMTRSDCVVAVGGGVVGDLAGFAAASYMRGVDFYNIPTTLLSQVDSSIGGKTAVNLSGVKNIVGAFYQPRGVIIDPDVLKTLPVRHFASGLAEAIKMALSSDEELFRLIEKGDTEENIEEIIKRALLIKKAVVEADEREGGIRKILNLGHTLGHGIEADAKGELYHGECVAIGMTAVCAGEARDRLISLLKKIGLPTEYKGDTESALAYISHDKKCDGGHISVIFVDRVGSFRIEKMSVDSFACHVREMLK